MHLSCDRFFCIQNYKRLKLKSFVCTTQMKNLFISYYNWHKYINTFENLLISDKKTNSVVLWCGTGREGHCRYDSPTHHSFPIAAGAGGKDFLPEISFYPAVGVLKFPTFTKA